MGLMRPDVGEFVVTLLVVLLSLGRLMRQPVGGALHLLLRIRMALAMFIDNGRLFGFREPIEITAPALGNPNTGMVVPPRDLHQEVVEAARPDFEAGFGRRAFGGISARKRV